jgi:hypothetical protein
MSTRAVRFVGQCSGVQHYSDTKIRLHFSHFKIVEESRDTCFYDEPHRCEDIAAAEEASSKSSSRHEEL